MGLTEAQRNAIDPAPGSKHNRNRSRRSRRRVGGGGGGANNGVTQAMTQLKLQVEFDEASKLAADEFDRDVRAKEFKRAAGGWVSGNWISDIMDVVYEKTPHYNAINKHLKAIDNIVAELNELAKAKLYESFDEFYDVTGFQLASVTRKLEDIQAYRKDIDKEMESIDRLSAREMAIRAEWAAVSGPRLTFPLTQTPFSTAPDGVSCTKLVCPNYASGEVPVSEPADVIARRAREALEKILREAEEKKLRERREKDRTRSTR